MNAKRDGEIKKDRKAGETLKQSAARHGLSPERIRQICGEAHSPSYRGKFMPNAGALPRSEAELEEA